MQHRGGELTRGVLQLVVVPHQHRQVQRHRPAHHQVRGQLHLRGHHDTPRGAAALRMPKHLSRDKDKSHLHPRGFKLRFSKFHTRPRLKVQSHLQIHPIHTRKISDLCLLEVGFADEPPDDLDRKNMSGVRVAGHRDDPGNLRRKQQTIPISCVFKRNQT